MIVRNKEINSSLIQSGKHSQMQSNICINTIEQIASDKLSEPYPLRGMFAFPVQCYLRV